MVEVARSRPLSRGRQKIPRQLLGGEDENADVWQMELECLRLCPSLSLCKGPPQLTCDECGEKGVYQPWRHCNGAQDGYGCAWGKWYCDTCWLKWFRSEGVPEPSLCPPRFEGKAVRQFGGRLVHIVQIGLGNFATFLQQDADWLDVLAGASSLSLGEPLRGIGVDPVEECVGPLEQLALEMEGASIIQAAVCEELGSGKLLCLPRGARMQVQLELKAKQVDHRTRAEVDLHLAYMENMSCMDVLHSDFMERMQYLQRVAGITTTLLEERSIPCYTFQQVLDLHEASGCEVLVVDAEGSDLAVVRSAVNACLSGSCPWPRVICFETMGHANDREHGNAEEEMVRWLQDQAGYLLVDAFNDTTLIHGPSLRAHMEVARWADRSFPLKCWNCGWWMMPSYPWFSTEMGSGYTQWRGLTGYELIGEWCCKCCLQRATDENPQGGEHEADASASTSAAPAGPTY